jgi:hypothetical protein
MREGMLKRSNERSKERGEVVIIVMVMLTEKVCGFIARIEDL